MCWNSRIVLSSVVQAGVYASFKYWRLINAIMTPDLCSKYFFLLENLILYQRHTAETCMSVSLIVLSVSTTCTLVRAYSTDKSDLYSYCQLEGISSLVRTKVKREKFIESKQLSGMSPLKFSSTQAIYGLHKKARGVAYFLLSKALDQSIANLAVWIECCFLGIISCCNKARVLNTAVSNWIGISYFWR